MTRNDARSRYTRNVLIASAVYGVSLIGGTAWFRQHPGSADALAYVIALIPGLSVAAIFAAIGRYLVDERDEYLRMLMVRQTLIASGFALSIATTWGFLESFGVVQHVEAYAVAILWYGGLGLGACVNKLTLGREA